MSKTLKKKRPYEAMNKTAQHIIKALYPYCERIEVAGSLRRKRSMIGDIEIVAIPKYQRNLFGGIEPDADTELDKFLNSRLREDDFIKNGRKYKQFKYGQLQVDLFLAVPENWGNILTIRTGSGDFSAWLVSQMGGMPTGMRQEKGFLWRGGKRIDCCEEQDFFDALGLPFVPLDMRDDRKWLEIVK